MQINWICFIIAFLPLKALAQTFPSEMSWYYCHSSLWPSNPQTCSLEILDNFRRNKDTLQSDFYHFTSINDDKILDEVKQINRQVWLNDELIYDFDLKQGGQIDIGTQSFSIDSVKTINILGKERMVQFVHVENINAVMVSGLGAAILYDALYDVMTYYFRPSDALFSLSADPVPYLTMLFEDNKNVMAEESGNCEPCKNLMYNNEINPVKLNLYPQPFTDVIKISGIEGQYSITICTMDGSMLKLHALSKGENEFDGRQLNPGTYIFIIKDEHGNNVFIKRMTKI